MNQARMVLKQVTGTSVDYTCEHITPSSEGTHLSFDVRLEWSQHAQTTEFICQWPSTVPAVGSSPAEALRKMARWLKRASETLETAAGQMPEHEHGKALVLVIDTRQQRVAR
jgi:hypothetical protein